MHGGIVIEPDNLVPGQISELPASDAFLIEDVAKWIGIKDHEEALFHLYNRCFASGEKLLIASRAFPNHWNILIADLASRLKAADVAEIGPPDDTLLMALLGQALRRPPGSRSTGCHEYVTPRIERSFAAIQFFAAAADGKALKDKRQITIPLARDVLSAIE